MTGCSNDRIVISYALRRDEHRALFEALAAVKKGPRRAAMLRALIFVGFERDGDIKKQACESRFPAPASSAMFDDLIDGRVE